MCFCQWNIIFKLTVQVCSRGMNKMYLLILSLKIHLPCGAKCFPIQLHTHIPWIQKSALLFSQFRDGVKHWNEECMRTNVSRKCKNHAPVDERLCSVCTCLLNLCFHSFSLCNNRPCWLFDTFTFEKPVLQMHQYDQRTLSFLIQIKVNLS